MDPLEAFCDHRPHAQQPWPLGRPVARRARTIFLAGNHDERDALGGVANRRLEDGGGLAVGQVHRERPFFVGQGVSEPDIGEGAAHHDFVVTAPRPIRVELERRHVVCLKPFAGGGPGRDRPGGGDVVGGHRVAQEREDAGVFDRRDRVGLGPQTGEEWRAGYVRGVVRPAISIAGRDVERTPASVAVEDRLVRFAE